MRWRGGPWGSGEGIRFGMVRFRRMYEYEEMNYWNGDGTSKKNRGREDLVSIGLEPSFTVPETALLLLLELPISAGSVYHCPWELSISIIELSITASGTVYKYNWNCLSLPLELSISTIGTVCHCPWECLSVQLELSVTAPGNCLSVQLELSITAPGTV